MSSSLTTIKQIYNKYITHAPSFTTRYCLDGPKIAHLHATIYFNANINHLEIKLTDEVEEWFKLMISVPEVVATFGFIPFAKVVGGPMDMFARLHKLKNGGWEISLLTDIYVRPVGMFWLDTIYPDEDSDDFKVPLVKHMDVSIPLGN